MHPQTGTSLGKLDRAERSLDEYIITMIAQSNTPLDGSYIELLVASWCYNNIFLRRDPRTQLTPDAVHLGTWKVRNLTSWQYSIQENPPLSEESTFGIIQHMLQLSYERKKVEDNISEVANNEKRKQLREHNTILEDHKLQKSSQSCQWSSSNQTWLEARLKKGTKHRTLLCDGALPCNTNHQSNGTDIGPNSKKILQKT